MRPARWPTVSVRVRILTSVLLLSALGLGVAGLTAYELQLRETRESASESLARAVTRFTELSTSGTDPQTGQAFTSPDRVVYVALSRAIVAPHEGMVGFVDGTHRWNASVAVAVRLEDDPELLAWAATAPTDRARQADVRTARTRYLAVTIPVHGEGATSAMLVVAADLTGAADDVRTVFRTYAFVALLALGLVGVVAWAVTGRLLSPLRVLARTAERMSDSDLSERIEVTGNDDVSHLTRTFNGMLERLGGAFASQRRLLDDVGHELRTPLTIIRGNLELMDTSDAADVEATRELALDELDRMNRLVDDLVTLAVVDSPDFVRPRPVEIGRLTDDVLERAGGLGDRRWRVDHRAEVRADVDEQRLSQAWLQLAANATKFSSPGSTVTLASRVDDDGLHLAVRDEGVGIPADQLPHVMGRFERGGRAADGASGAGLGLPIVDAIARAHGGRVSIESIVGVGTTVTLVLPPEVLLSVEELESDDVAPAGVADPAQPTPNEGRP